MKLIDCSFEGQAAEILDIFNDAIVNTTALFDYQARTMEFMAKWFSVKESNRYPVIGMVDQAGKLLGFASYGQFRAWPAYKYTLEHSVYVERDHWGQGIGLSLLRELIARARFQDYHCLVAGIEATNAASIALHQKLGFTPCGIIRQAGYKFGRWLDLSFYQLILDTPANPIGA